MRILTAAQMREADRYTIEDIGIPSLVLMENAGRQVVAAMEARLRGAVSAGRVAVLCGRGNNGGDGFVVARTLLQRGVDVAVFVIGSRRPTFAATRASISTSSAGSASPVVEIGDEQTLGAALLRDLPVHADRRRDVRHRPQGDRSAA